MTPFTRVVEELYASESFHSEQQFLRKAAYYQAQFNCMRHNSYKGTLSSSSGDLPGVTGRGMGVDSCDP